MPGTRGPGGTGSESESTTAGRVWDGKPHHCDAVAVGAPDGGRWPLYQGRFKSFPVQGDEHLLTVARYVERNALGAGLVERAEHWPYGSLYARSHPDDPAREILADWPIERPADWVERVNTPLSAGELR